MILINSIFFNKSLFLKSENNFLKIKLEKKVQFKSKIFFLKSAYKTYFLKKFFLYFYLLQLISYRNSMIKLNFFFLDKKKKKKNLIVFLSNFLTVNDFLKFLSFFVMLDFFFKVSSTPINWKILKKKNYLYFYINNLNYLNQFFFKKFKSFLFKNFTGFIFKFEFKNKNYLNWFFKKLKKLLNEKK